MKVASIAATPLAFFLPSRSAYVDAGKLALVGMIFTTFFLFTSGYNFPGGASHYPNWAEAIVHGTTLPPDVAQREVGFALLYILGAFPFTHSFIGITLILALFAVLIPVLVYWCIVRSSPGIAFYTGLVCILSLAPFTYMKFFYPDQAYIFFNLLSVTLLIEFLWTGRSRMLYFFTVAALAASFTRTAGNLMYPVLLTIAYLTVGGRFRHYLGCALIFALATGAYQWHRYEIFDMRHQASIPSGKGMQILYATYLYLGDFGYRLSPDMGPNTKRLLEKLGEALQPNVRDSALVKQNMGASPPEFMEQHVYRYTPEELLEKISTEPNEEYYWDFVYAVDTNDQFFLDVAKEIALSHPWYVVQYSMRNLWHVLFDPGYATTRYNTQGYLKTNNDFVPAAHSWGVYSADPVTQFSERAAREMEYFQLKTQPAVVQQIFASVERLWSQNYGLYVFVSSVLIVAAWVGVLLGALCWVIPRTRFCRAVTATGVKRLIAPILAASALVLYEDLATSVFCQPVWRYFHLTEPLRLVIAGFGAIFVADLLSSWQTSGEPNRKVPRYPRVKRIISAIQNYISEIQKDNLIDAYFDRRLVLWLLLLVGVNVSLFAWWTTSVMAHTWGPLPVEIVSATYGQNCRGFVPTPPAVNRVSEGNVTKLVDKTCIFYKCDLLVDDKSWGDPAPGCAKDFTVSYRCRGDQKLRTASIDAEAAGKTAKLDCYVPPPSAIAILSATYGQSCSGFLPPTGATNWVREGNVTEQVREACAGTDNRCTFRVDNVHWGDPADGCGKDFSVSYQCKGEQQPRTAGIGAEAAGKKVKLDCSASRQGGGSNPG